MKDMGVLHYCLGVSVTIKDGVLQISQEQYIGKIMRKYKLQDCKTVSTPMDFNVKLVKDDGYSKPVYVVQYQSMVTVALSTSESEYIALRFATQEAVWLRQLMKDLQMDCTTATTIYEDNQGAIAMSRNPVLHKRTKHIDIKYHFIREKTQDGTIELKYCPTNEMLADILTKPLSKGQFEYLRCKLGLIQGHIE
ncbi:Hypothetical predicted protein [Paramuricea clavata]|uniref:Uncharacterized protein n=1 Tax=Paramuricea clavata TaxID=317549 RepID=A0A7D9LAD0_PARCT|nr:Hypothetical predicted protein [Paramuricea clavata]